MRSLKMNFNMSIYSLKEKILKVDLDIIYNDLKEYIQFYTGKFKYFDLSCNSEDIKKDDNFLFIKNNKNIKISYKIKIGNFGKHGHKGTISDDLIAFSGDEVFLFPIEVLSIDDKKESDFIKEIKIKYDFNKNLSSIVPFYSKEEDVSIIRNPYWHHIYELIKSPYVFGKFKDYNFKKDNLDLNIYNDNEESINEEVLNGIKDLYSYYCSLFNTYKKHIDIIILRKEKDNNYILSGSGKNLIGSTFDFDNLRDWELLSHRLFHSFMDSKIKVKDFHRPPNLWITEGLATYYENIALESLNETLKFKLKVDSDYEFLKIYKRYLYITLKDPNRFSIIPMEEGKITSGGKIEYLHYTKAPLIIKFIEDKRSKANLKENAILDYILNIKDFNNYNLKDMFYKVLGMEVNIFAMNYLFGTEILPMFYLNNRDENLEETIKDLNDYEYILWTCFFNEDSFYVKDKLSSYKLFEILKKAERENVRFAPILLEKEIEGFSKTIYALLKEYFLRAKLCKIPYGELNMRYFILEDKNNIKIWSDFLSKV